MRGTTKPVNTTELGISRPKAPARIFDVHHSFDDSETGSKRLVPFDSRSAANRGRGGRIR